MAYLKKIDDIILELEKDVKDIKEIQVIAQNLANLSKLTFDIQGDISKEAGEIRKLIAQEEQIRINIQNSVNKLDEVSNVIVRIDNTLKGQFIEFEDRLKAQNLQHFENIHRLFEDQKKDIKEIENLKKDIKEIENLNHNLQRKLSTVNIICILGLIIGLGISYLLLSR